MNPLLQAQITDARKRFDDREAYRERNIRLIKEHRYFDIDTSDRVKKFLSRRGMSQMETTEILKSVKGMPAILEADKPTRQFLSLERVMGTNDLVGIAFLHTAIEISKTVGRIWICGPGNKLVGYGTGFMVSPTLMLTNHHVLPDKNLARQSKIEFRYELDVDNNPLVSQSFDLNPDSFFISDKELDFALVAVIPENAAKYSLGEFGWNKLSLEEGKTIISQWLNIIQHPNGMPKQVGLRENQLVDVLENFLHYKTDTAPGSSGSPVYNERWEVVALHHAGTWQQDKNGGIVSVDGGKWNQSMGEDKIKWIANEGIRVSKILKYLDAARMNSEETRLYDELRTAKPMNTPEKFLSKKISSSPSNNSHFPMSSNSTQNPDGSVTMQVPLTVTFQLGNGALTLNVPPNGKDSTMATPAASDKRDENSILARAKEQFGKRGDVVNVRLGYVFKNGWITRERAIVVSVLTKKSIHQLNKEKSTALPDKFEDYPVEVTTPTIAELISAKHGHEKFEALVSPTNVLREEITYFPPPNEPLEEVTDTMKVIAHVSPEEGWKMLKPFLSGIKKSVTVGMYDFGATHIVDEIISATKGKPSFKKMMITLQPGESLDKKGTKKNDIQDKEAVRRLSKALGKKFENAWIKKGSVNGWISSSYHIKVAVRDSKAFWLSSGNWQSSNQPNLASVTGTTPKELLNKYNREWHAIVENEELAKKFETYIKHDFENNKDFVPKTKEATMEEFYFLVPQAAHAVNTEATQPLKFFKPFNKTRKFTVKPLLTPDNYFEETLALIREAEEELWIQNQTFNAPKEGQDKLEEIVNAVLEKHKAGVDVRIIFRSFMPSVARENLEMLVDMGFDENKIRTHSHVHTKGIIVDGKKVMLGSQNISNDGVSVNRDASLIFSDPELAKWFRDIFEHDYLRLATQDIGEENLAIEMTTDPTSIPEGMELLTWTDVKELL